MRPRRGLRVSGALAVGCLVSLSGATAARRAAAPRLAPGTLVARTGGGSLFQRQLSAAWRYRTEARLAVTKELMDLEAWDPAATDPLLPNSLDPEAWRLQRMARDEGGELRRAWMEAKGAARAARTALESYRAIRLLVFIEHEVGRHDEELQHGRLLVLLRAGEEEPRLLLKRAARCSGTGALQPWGARHRLLYTPPRTWSPSD